MNCKQLDEISLSSCVPNSDFRPLFVTDQAKSARAEPRLLKKFADFVNFAQFVLKFHVNCLFFTSIFCLNGALGAVQKCANLVELEKCCQTMSNAYLIAKIGFDTAEN